MNGFAGGEVQRRFGKFQMVFGAQGDLRTGNLLYFQFAEFFFYITPNCIADIEMFAGDVVVHHPLLFAWVNGRFVP